MVAEDVRINENAYKSNLGFFVCSQMRDMFLSLLDEEGRIDGNFAILTLTLLFV